MTLNLDDGIRPPETARRPVLLLIPGMLNTSRIWSRVAPFLAEQADILIADVTSQTSIKEMALDAWAMVAALPKTRRLIICGFSMGGYVALQLIAEYLSGPGARDNWALALVNTSSLGETPEGKVKRQKTIQALDRDFERTILGIARFGIHPSNQANEQLMMETLSIMREAGAGTASRQLQAIMDRHDHSWLLSQISAKTIVVSSKDDLVVSPDASLAMANEITGARLVWIESAGHMTPLEQPNALASAIATLL